VGEGGRGVEGWKLGISRLLMKYLHLQGVRVLAVSRAIL
jgi:hypothetical protein